MGEYLMESSAVLNSNGAIFTDNDVCPLDIRTSFPLSGKSFPHQGRARVGSEWVQVRSGDVAIPKLVAVWNQAGCELTTFPGEEEAERIRQSVLLVAFSDKVPRIPLHPGIPGKLPMGGAVILPLCDGEQVWLRAAVEGVIIPVRYIVAG